MRDKFRGVKVILCGENKKNKKPWEWKYLPGGARNEQTIIRAYKGMVLGVTEYLYEYE